MQRTTTAAELKESLKFDIWQKSEIMSLRRLDQTENLKRRTNFDKMCRERLADDILEKQHRAEIVTSEQKRLKEMCYRQRATFKGFMSAKNATRSPIVLH